MKKLVLVTALLALASCKGLGLGSLDLDEPDPPAGLSKLDTETSEQKENQNWFDSYYSGSHGWGWTAPKEEKDPSCSLYGTCDDAGSGSGGPGKGLGW